ncbi:MAG: hypothetical protein J6X79_07875, partial [Bacteroidales bacterium]|nr:hypothetical protein [Bacteroidales bacterium]
EALRLGRHGPKQQHQDKKQGFVFHILIHILVIKTLLFRHCKSTKKISLFQKKMQNMSSIFLFFRAFSGKGRNATIAYSEATIAYFERTIWGIWAKCPYIAGCPVATKGTPKSKLQTNKKRKETNNG